METFIVNLTVGSFFRYRLRNNDDTGYNKVLLELLTPPNSKEPYAHWSREDEIVRCPIHLHNYVEHHYNELYLH